MWYFLRPTNANYKAYRLHCTSHAPLHELVPPGTIEYLHLWPGNVLYIPPGWIHAVYTLPDRPSTYYGGTFFPIAGMGDTARYLRHEALLTKQGDERPGLTERLLKVASSMVSRAPTPAITAAFGVAQVQQSFSAPHALSAPRCPTPALRSTTHAGEDFGVTSTEP